MLFILLSKIPKENIKDDQKYSLRDCKNLGLFQKKGSAITKDSQVDIPTKPWKNMNGKYTGRFISSENKALNLETPVSVSIRFGERTIQEISE